MKIKSVLKDRSKGFYLGTAAAGLSLATAVVYLIYALSVQLFQPVVFVMMLLGALSFALVMLTDWAVAPLIPTVLYGLSFGLHLFDRVEMFAYMATGIYGMGEKGAILSVVVVLLVMSLISAVLGCISCFMAITKQEELDKLDTEQKTGKNGLVKIGLAGAAAVVVVAILVIVIIPGGQSKTPKEVVLTGIEISAVPTKTEYSLADYFNAEGMVVSAIYSDGTSGQVTGYDINLDAALTEDIDHATITYMGFTADCSIAVKEILFAEFAGQGENGEEASISLMEHGVAYITLGASNEKTGTWSNSGKIIYVTIDRNKYEAEETNGAYSLEILTGDTTYKLNCSETEELLVDGIFTGTSPAGEVLVILNEDGTLGGNFGSVAIEGYTWEKQGMEIALNIHFYVEGRTDSTFECVATKASGIYATKVEADLGPYSLSADVVYSEAVD